MRSVRHKVWALALSLLMIAMGQAIAVARAGPAVAGQMEICTGTGPVMVFIDAEGQPVSPPRFCPEGALALFGAVVALLPGPSNDGAPNSLRTVSYQVTAPFLPLRAATARGPPAELQTI